MKGGVGRFLFVSKEKTIEHIRLLVGEVWWRGKMKIEKRGKTTGGGRLPRKQEGAGFRAHLEDLDFEKRSELSPWTILRTQ